ncbi:MAG: LCP family protein [Eubacterium sp.]|nr:LCP family protein [Eubacterium sp.]
MKLFKNRGDIYIPKSDYKKSKEEMILKILLVFIVIFTVVFLILLNHKYNSTAQFFGDGEVTTTQIAVEEEELPKISGKTNFLIFETDDSQEIIHYIMLIQADRDTKAYKICSLSPETKIDNKSILEIYKSGGGASLQTKLTEYFGFEINYYAEFDNSSFVDFASKFGSMVCFSDEDIRFSGGGEDDKYTIHINEGEQNINGKELSNLLRYYCLEKKQYSLENELFLSALTQLFNEKNYEDCDSLFRLFIKSSTSNITVRDFENSKNALMIFCLKNTDITVYNTVGEYKSNVLTQQSVKNIKGYFSK